MSDRSGRGWRTAVAVTVMALAGPSVAAAATQAKPAQPGAQGKAPPAHGPANIKAGHGEGIVQTVSGSTIVVRQLDGSALNLTVTPGTNVFVDGKRATLGDINAGFVASAAWSAGGTARVLQAFDLAAKHALTVGVVESVSTGAVVVTQTGVTSASGGTKLTIAVNAKTRVLVDGKPAALSAVKAGYTVVFTAADAKHKQPAHELRFLRPV
jgi:hypothetical protein